MDDFRIRAAGLALDRPAHPAGAPGAPPGAGFGDLLRTALEGAQRLEQEAGAAVATVAAGREQDLHNTMIALEKADVSFQLLMQVRNRVVAAYETIMRMQV